MDATVLADLQRRAAALADVCRPWLEQQEPGGAEALRTALAGAGETLLATENSSVSAVSAPSGMFEAFRQAAMEGRSARLEAASVTDSGQVYLVSYYLLEDRAFCAQAKLEYDGAGAAPRRAGADGHRKLAFYRKGQSAF